MAVYYFNCNSIAHVPHRLCMVVSFSKAAIGRETHKENEMEKPPSPSLFHVSLTLVQRESYSFTLYEHRRETAFGGHIFMRLYRTSAIITNSQKCNPIMHLKYSQFMI